MPALKKINEDRSGGDKPRPYKPEKSPGEVGCLKHKQRGEGNHEMPWAGQQVLEAWSHL